MQKQGMTDFAKYPERQADKRADKRSYIFFFLFLMLSLFIEATSLQIEAGRGGKSLGWAEPWLREFASHFLILLLSPLFPYLLNRVQISRDSWLRALGIITVGGIGFSVLHVLGMVGMRKALYPPLLGYNYNFGLSDPINWIYEMRKDVFTYILFLFGFMINWSMEQNRLEASAASDQAETNKRITLKSGGRTIFLIPDEILSARAAGNYVEVATKGKTHLARTTLTSLEKLLEKAGSNHVRVHRSLLLKSDLIREIVPRGQGDVDIHLQSGEIVKGSRRYKHRIRA